MAGSRMALHVTPKYGRPTGPWHSEKRAGTDNTDETDEMIHEKLSGKIIGAGMDVPLSCREGNVTLHPVDCGEAAIP
jgi:hypothetical protein